MTLRRLIAIDGYIGILLLAVAVCPAMAQQPAHSLKVNDQVRVTDKDGNKLNGRIVDLSAGSLRLQMKGTEREIPESMIREVKKRRLDRWWDGTVKGAAAGAAFGLVAGAVVSQLDDCDPGECSTLPGVTAACSGIGAGVGALLDAAIRRYDTVFTAAASTRSVRFAPIVSKARKGVQLSLSF